jgi:tRNA pseudouridine38/39 synthase
MKKFALKIAYIGVTYNGLTIQKSTDNTVEAYLFRSLYSLSLVRGLEPGEDYTRAGRTDTGVSAFGNVVSLYMRSSEVREGVKEG